MNAIFTRRSVRKFEEKVIETDKIEMLLKAAMQAPSARNQAAWEFIVVENKEKLKELSTYKENIPFVEKCGCSIVILGDKDKMTVPNSWQQDLGAAAQNLMLQAVELGLGTVWCGAWGTDERVENLKKIFSLPDNLMPYAVIAVGYPAAEKANFFVDRYDESRVKYIK